MIDTPLTLCDRALLDVEQPRALRECQWITALIVAGYSAAAAGLAHDIQGFASGKTPWDNPGEWTTGALKAGAIGFGGGALGAGVGAAVGPMLGAGSGAAGGTAAGVGSGVTGGAVGGAEGAAAGIGGMTLAEGASGVADALSLVGQGVGTTAAEAGAATPATVAGVIPQQSAQFLNAGTQGTQGVVREALGNVAKNTVSGAVTGGIKDPENFGRGALMGAAGGAASGVFNSGANALFRGQGAGIVPNSADGPNRGFSMMGDSGGDFGRAYNPNTASSGFDNFMDNNQFGYDPGRETFSISRANIATPPPTLASRAMDLGINQGSNMAGRAASRMVGSAMTPTPEDPMSQNPYAQYGRNPYWMRRM